MSPKVEQMVFIGGNIPAQLRDRLKKVADDNDRKVAAEIRLAIRAHVEAHENDAQANGGAA